jgi:death-on-curing protein
VSEVRHLDRRDLEAVSRAVLGGPLPVRDEGLLASALARPAATAFGEDAYPTVFDKAAALLQSLVGNHVLVDGNKRVGFTAAVLLLHKNGIALRFEEDEAYDVVIAVAERTLTEVAELAAALVRWSA